MLHFISLFLMLVVSFVGGAAIGIIYQAAFKGLLGFILSLPVCIVYGIGVARLWMNMGWL